MDINHTNHVNHINQLTDAELITLLVNLKQPCKEVGIAWQEFLSRFERTIVGSIHAAFYLCAPELKVTTTHICDMAERVFEYLSEDDFKPLMALEYQVKNRLLGSVAKQEANQCQDNDPSIVVKVIIEKVLQRLTVEIVQEYLAEMKTAATAKLKD
ncbi:MAG: hypothetical protein AB1489_35190 [Acidobacteriota bacterium]